MDSDDVLARPVGEKVCIGESLIKAAAAFVSLGVRIEVLDPIGGLAEAVKTTKTNDREADALALADAHALTV